MGTMTNPISELAEEIHNFLDAVEPVSSRELIETGTEFLMAIHNYQKQLAIEESRASLELCFLVSETEESCRG